MITCLRSNVLITVYLIVISSILQKYHSQVWISIISHILNSFVYKIIIQANMFHNTSLNASQTHKDTQDIKSQIFNHIISKLMKSVNSIRTRNKILHNNLAILAAHVGFVSSKCFLMFLLIIFVIIFDTTVKRIKTITHAQIFNQYEIIALSVMLFVQVSILISWFVSKFSQSISYFLFYKIVLFYYIFFIYYCQKNIKHLKILCLLFLKRIHKIVACLVNDNFFIRLCWCFYFFY